uniref:Coagulation factor X n=1 Tax=Leptobrachium leishanense TaxID=445787 RepID=A0A8C5MR10_9ANUR
MLCIMCVLAHPMEFTFALSLSVFIKRERAHHVLRKRANYFLEEMLPGDLERECYEETCSREEAREIFKSQEKTRIFSDLSPCKMSPCENGGICQQYHYSYTCLCPPRFMGRHCENGRHECWYKNGDCWQYCADTPRAMSVTCSCANGYTLNMDGKSCEKFVFNSLSPLPWFQVLIRSHRGYEICSGSLISNRWVLSAAHCFEAVNPHHVTVGDYDKFRRDQDEQKIAVLKFFSHPHYFAEHYDHDIALLYLRSPVIFNEYARPICLPTPSLGRLLTQEGEIGQVSGWGATRYMGPSSRFLLRVRLPIVKQEDCIASTAKMFTGNMFCAGYRTEVKDSCQGDSGGPFAVAYRQTWYLVGVVSWGEKCASEGKFGVYTRVANYIPWIKETIIDNDATYTRLLCCTIVC